LIFHPEDIYNLLGYPKTYGCGAIDENVGEKNSDQIER
jgi:hypothetical protein